MSAVTGSAVLALACASRLNAALIPYVRMLGIIAESVISRFGERDDVFAVCARNGIDDRAIIDTVLFKGIEKFVLIERAGEGMTFRDDFLMEKE